MKINLGDKIIFQDNKLVKTGTYESGIVIHTNPKGGSYVCTVVKNNNSGWLLTNENFENKKDVLKQFVGKKKGYHIESQWIKKHIAKEDL